MADDLKTPAYTRRAIAAYNAKFDRVQVNLPKGTKERIHATGESMAAFINRVVLLELERLEKSK